MGRGKKLSVKSFRDKVIERFKNHHHLNFDITNYVNSSSKVDFSCSYHGIISIYPNELLRSNGCPKCSKENKKHPWLYWEKNYKDVHGDLFKYHPEKYVNSKTPMPIDCKIHGTFMQTPANHKLHGCPKCSIHKRGIDKRLNFNDFKEKCEKINPDKFEFIDENYQGYNYRIGIKCKKCRNTFLALVKNLLNTGGYGCPHCKNSIIGEKNSLTSEEFYTRCEKKHNNYYTYPKKDFTDMYSVFSFVCPIHGEKITKAINHLTGCKCNECALLDIGNSSRLTLEEFLIQARSAHTPNRYNYDKYKYVNFKTKGEIFCNECNKIFFQSPESHVRGHGCPYCFHPDSKWEVEIREFINSLGIKTEKNTSILDGQEIDIYIPDKKIGIECNGIYFHSINGGGKTRNYHFNKTEKCISKGIQLLHIWENEWRDSKDLLKSMIKSKLGIVDNNIYARKCVVKELSTTQTRLFLDANHIQGSTGSNKKYGLFFNDSLVACMTFKHHDKHQWELNRFCTLMNTRIIGGASKLLSHFIKQNNPDQIVSFANRRYSDGKLYESLGFSFIHNTSYSYYYTDYKHTYPKNGFRLEKLKKKYTNFDPAKTENENAIALGFDRIYDSGLKKYLWRKKE